MRMVCLQHVSFEDAGAIAPWATAREHRFDVVRLDKGQVLPAVSDVDWLIVMGGPMSVHDEKRFPWLRGEKAFIARVIGEGRLVLGICLGAQMIAQVLGARVFPGANREIGWFPVNKMAQAKGVRVLDTLPDILTPFHWHGESFDIPLGAVHAFGSQGCPNQAFVCNERVVALQFHLEMMLPGVRRLVRNCPGDLKAGPYVQAADVMTGNTGAFANAHLAMNSLLDRLESLPITKGANRG